MQISRLAALPAFLAQVGIRVPIFHLCNDAVAITPRATWRRTDDRLFGLAVPDDKLATEILVVGDNYDQLDQKIKKYGLAVQADGLVLCPLNPKYPTIIIAVWAQKGPVSAEVHALRWRTAREYLQKLGIHIISHGADGDPAHLKAQKAITEYADAGDDKVNFLFAYRKLSH